MTFRFLFREGLSSIRRVTAASVIGALLTGVSLAIVGGFLLVALAYRAELARAQDSAMVEVFLADDVDSVRAESIATEMTTFPNVTSARVRSRKEALELFGADTGGDTILFKSGLPLPTTIQVELQEEARSIEGMTETGKRFQEISGVDEVSFPSELVRTVEERSEIFLRLAVAIGAILSLGVIGTVAITAQLTVVSRRTVIRTMQLLGAEQRWVLAPFIIQGFIIGLAGGAVSTLGLYGSGMAFPGLSPLLQSSSLTYLPLLFPLVGGLFGMLGAAIASGYYVAREGRA